jgi:hypothetical protein
LLLSGFDDALATKEDRSSIVKTEAPGAMHVNTDPVDMQIQKTAASFSGQPLSDKIEVPRPTELAAIKTAAVVERSRTRSSKGILQTAYSDEAFRVFLDANGFTSEDNRGKNGALWVHLDDEGSEPARQLVKWGFKYKAGRGWWRK